jgi:Na+/melibiose symporter-like transporter
MLRRIGPRNVIIAAALIYAIFPLGFLALPPNAPAGALLLLYFAIGIPFAGIQVGPFAQVAHLVHASAQSTERRQEGLFTGLWTAGEKLGLALGPGVAGVSLALIGFHQGRAAQPDAVMHSLDEVLAFAPAAFFLLSIVVLAFGDANTGIPRREKERVVVRAADARLSH